MRDTDFFSDPLPEEEKPLSDFQYTWAGDSRGYNIYKKISYLRQIPIMAVIPYPTMQESPSEILTVICEHFNNKKLANNVAS